MNVNEALNVLGIAEESLDKEALKKAYRRSAQKYHPDRNPQGEKMMQMINEAYDYLKNLAADTIQRTPNNKGFFDIYDFGEQMNHVINVLAEYEDLELKMMGNWLWIHGNTKGHKELLKELRCMFAPKKKVWYFRPKEHRVMNRDERSLEELQNKYGEWTYRKNKNFKPRLEQKGVSA